MDKLYIVIPAYNEQDTIKTVVNEWYSVIDAVDRDQKTDCSRLLVIDDGSQDNTSKILYEMSLQMPKLISVTRKNSGHGATVLYGYQYAILAGADYIFQTDSDGQTLSKEFDQFWKQRHNYDLIIGHRNSRRDGINRIFVTKVLKLMLKIFFGVWVIDANTPYRIMKKSTLEKYIDLIPPDFNLTNVLITVIFTKKSTRIKYIPITFRNRQGGKNSINFKKISKIGINAIRDFKHLNKLI